MQELIMKTYQQPNFYRIIFRNFLNHYRNCSKGTKSYKNGSTYVGPIKNGLAHGKGTTTFKCGDIYVGTFVNDKRTGKAEYTWKGSGNYYVGSFLKGKLHGKGTVT